MNLICSNFPINFNNNIICSTNCRGIIFRLLLYPGKIYLKNIPFIHIVGNNIKQPLHRCRSLHPPPCRGSNPPATEQYHLPTGEKYKVLPVIVLQTLGLNIHKFTQQNLPCIREPRVFGYHCLQLGYLKIPEGMLISADDLDRYPDEEITVVTTGSQGEPMSALSRMAFGEHDRVTLTSRDVVVLSAKAIPGNEKLVGKIINALVLAGIRVENDDSIEDIHVSGHACSEELKLMLALTRPRFFMPIHGEARHLYAHKSIAEFMGIPGENVFLGENGRVLELDGKTAKWRGTIPSGCVMIDGSGIGDVGAAVLRDRKLLSEDGLIAVVATLDRTEGLLMSGPEIVSRGFVYMKESGKLMDEVRSYAAHSLQEMLDRGITDFNELKTTLRDELSRLLFKKTRRRPMVLPILLDL